MRTLVISMLKGAKCQTDDESDTGVESKPDWIIRRMSDRSSEHIVGEG